MGKFGSLIPSDKPFRVHIKLDGKQILDKDDKPFYIDVHAEDSVAGRRFDKDWRERLLALSKEGKDQPTAAEYNEAKCAALTVGWYLVDPDTLEPIDEPCTPANVKELYSNPNMGWLWVQPWLAANSPANFIKRSAKNSTSTQSGTFETTES